MSTVDLPDLRIGFDYAANFVLAPGFLAPGENLRAKLRRYAGKPVADAIFTATRNGDTVTLELPKETTALLEPGTYITEAIIHTPANPGFNEIPLGDNIFMLEVTHSPSY